MRREIYVHKNKYKHKKAFKCFVSDASDFNSCHKGTLSCSLIMSHCKFIPKERQIYVFRFPVKFLLLKLQNEIYR